MGVMTQEKALVTFMLYPKRSSLVTIENMLDVEVSTHPHNINQYQNQSGASQWVFGW